LMAHDYPGNVRELENILERAFVLCASGKIDRAHLPPELTGQRPPPSPATDATLAGRTRAAEEQALRSALEGCGFNRTAAAASLGLHKSTFFRKMRALGIALPERDGRSRR
ncbi:MAG: Fis family transcriptional regulator, partial [Verrucomicrobia bacterium]|nr:Fis family transcriptional regulator [Verrucomicrobiota bacterium]